MPLNSFPNEPGNVATFLKDTLIVCIEVRTRREVSESFMKKFETAHTISPVYDRLAQYSRHVPVTAEFEFEYKKMRKERENVLTPAV